MNLRVVAPATFFVAVQFYTSLQALSPTPPVGFTFLGRGGALALVTVVALSALGCAYALGRARAPIARTALAGTLAAWIGATLASSALGLAPLAGVQIVATQLLGAAFAFALVRFYPEPGVARAVLGAYLIAGTLACVAGIAMVLAREPRALYGLAYGRAAGVFVTSNQFAEFANLFTFVALGVAWGVRSPALRRAGALGAVAGVLAEALTFSREGWLGAAAAAVFLCLASGRRRAAALVVAAALAGAVAIALRPLPHHDPSDSFSRLRTLDAGIRVAELFPLTGAGPVDFFRVYPAIRPVNGPAPGTFGALHPHDAYLSLAGELGFAGLALVLWGWLGFGRAVAAALRARAPRERGVALGACAALVAVLVAGIFDTIGVVQMTFVWIPYAGLALASAESAAPA